MPVQLQMGALTSSSSSRKSPGAFPSFSNTSAAFHPCADSVPYRRQARHRPMTTVTHTGGR